MDKCKCNSKYEHPSNCNGCGKRICDRCIYFIKCTHCEEVSNCSDCTGDKRDEFVCKRCISRQHALEVVEALKDKDKAAYDVMLCLIQEKFDEDYLEYLAYN